mmetsp:Transcript_40291/g.72993  ORF Transcript_40291/g.72993 Transcript_40291/m.72993 type:complete len:202 (+) Transcript_40291:914-1519(+)
MALSTRGSSKTIALRAAEKSACRMDLGSKATSKMESWRVTALSTGRTPPSSRACGTTVRWLGLVVTAFPMGLRSLAFSKIGGPQGRAARAGLRAAHTPADFCRTRFFSTVSSSGPTVAAMSGTSRTRQCTGWECLHGQTPTAFAATRATLRTITFMGKVCSSGRAERATAASSSRAATTVRAPSSGPATRLSTAGSGQRAR